MTEGPRLELRDIRGAPQPVKFAGPCAQGVLDPQLDPCTKAPLTPREQLGPGMPTPDHGLPPGCSRPDDRQEFLQVLILVLSPYSRAILGFLGYPCVRHSLTW